VASLQGDYAVRIRGLSKAGCVSETTATFDSDIVARKSGIRLGRSTVDDAASHSSDIQRRETQEIRPVRLRSHPNCQRGEGSCRDFPTYCDELKSLRDAFKDAIKRCGQIMMPRSGVYPV
jgi:hypothetical protein